MFAMLKFLGLSCDIILHFFSKSFLLLLFCQIVVILTRIFFGIFSFLWEILVGSFAESCLPAVNHRVC
jgi:hypothetical protein